MTISNTDRSVTAQGNSLTTQWPFEFNIPTVEGVNVLLTEIALGIQTVIGPADYTVTGLGTPSAGEIVYPTVLSGDPPITSAFEITTYRTVPKTQEVTVTNQTQYDAGVTENVWDKLTMMVQDLSGDVELSLHYPLGDTATTELPAVVLRANKIISFNSIGDVEVTPFTVSDITSGILGSADSAAAALVSELAAAASAAAALVSELAAAASAAAAAAELPPFGFPKLDTDVTDVLASVEDYGAVGDDVADDTVEIQAALDALNYPNLVQGKTYLVSSTLTVPADTTFDGNGATIHYTGVGDTCIDIIGDNASVLNMTINGPVPTDIYVANSYGVECTGASSAAYISRPTVKNVTINNFGHGGIFLQYVEHANITENHIERIGQSGVRCLSIRYSKVLDNTIIDIYPGNAGAAPYLNAYGITLSSAGADPVSTLCQVRGNYIENIPSWEGIDVHSGSHITIANNILKDVRTAIAITTNAVADCQNIDVIGNNSEGFASGVFNRDATNFDTGSGVVANMGEVGSQGIGLTITGNVFANHGGKQSGSSGGGIKVERAEVVTIGNNVVRNAYKRGIRVADTVDGASVTGNMVYMVTSIDSVQEGISFATTAKATCNDNIVTAAGTDAFFIPTPASSQYGVNFGEGNRTPDGSGMMSTASQGNIVSGSYLGAAKAWVKFNGNTGAITESFGVTSVVRNSVGDYTITWKSSHADNLVFAASSLYYNRVITMNATSCNIKTYNAAQALADVSPIAVSMFAFKNN